MAVTYYPEVIASAAWEWDELMSSTITSEVIQRRYPYPSLSGPVGSVYLNKVWDTVAGGWVFWSTDFEDVDGVFYPGPGNFGVSTFNYRVEMITFSEQ